MIDLCACTCATAQVVWEAGRLICSKCKKAIGTAVLLGGVGLNIFGGVIAEKLEGTPAGNAVARQESNPNVARSPMPHPHSEEDHRESPGQPTVYVAAPAASGSTIDVPPPGSAMLAQPHWPHRRTPIYISGTLPPDDLPPEWRVS